VMNTEQVVSLLRTYNQWRRGEGKYASQTGMPFYPEELGLAIDAAVELLTQDALRLKPLREAKPDQSVMLLLKSNQPPHFKWWRTRITRGLFHEVEQACVGYLDYDRFTDYMLRINGHQPKENE